MRDLTDSQRSFLHRAAQLKRHDMGIIPRGFLQRKMVDTLETALLLEYAGWGTHEETGVESPMWKITDAGLNLLESLEARAVLEAKP